MIKIYTDGSCINNGKINSKGGWAFIIIDSNNTDNIEYLIYDSGFELNTTNNIMELKAVINSLKSYNHSDNFTIYTDSKYVINCATGIYKRNLNIDLWNDYDNISKNKNINFIWVKGHSGDYYNELVDKMAKSAYN